MMGTSRWRRSIVIGGFVHSARRIGTEKVEIPSSAPTRRRTQNIRRKVERWARRKRMVFTACKCIR
jgi:hypothetical protein